MSYGNLTNGMPYSGGTSSIVSNIRSAVMNPRTLIIIFALLFIIGVGLYTYYYIIAPKFKPSYVANNEVHPSSSNQGKIAELLLFSADWCPHCKVAKPEWNEAKAEYNGKTINGYTVLFTDVNCTTESPEVEQKMSQYKVEGFPTIKLLKDGQVIEFDAKPTKKNLDQFINTVL
jgi:hypothetical protein